VKNLHPNTRDGSPVCKVDFDRPSLGGASACCV
jgi:hypothetical protein